MVRACMGVCVCVCVCVCMGVCVCVLFICAWLYDPYDYGKPTLPQVNCLTTLCS